MNTAQEKKAAEMTAAQAAKLVSFEVAKVDDNGDLVVDKDGNQVFEKKALRERDIFAFKVHEDGTLNVVTVAGKKLTAKVN